MDRSRGKGLENLSENNGRIALAIESSGPGGAEQTVLHLAEGLREAGSEPVIITLRPGWMTERAEQAGVAVWILPQASRLAPTWAPRLALRLRRERIRALHSHEFVMNVYGGAAALLARIPHVATIHGRRWVHEQRRRVLAYRLLRRAGMRLVAVSHDLAGYVAEGFELPLDALDVVQNGIPLPARADPALRSERRRAARVAAGLPLEGRMVLAVGNLYPVKDHATLLRATARLPEDVRVAIAGRGEEEANLRRLASELGLASRCQLLGVRDDVERLLAAADVFVQPSRSEGLPLAVLEAMAAGLPVVASRVGGIPEAVVEGRTGLLVEPGEPALLAGALEQVLADADRAASMGEAGRRRSEEEFSIQTMVQRYLRLYSAGGSRRD